MKVAGRGFTDGKDINISCHDSDVLDEIYDHKQIMVINDVHEDRKLEKNLLQHFSLKVHNMLIMPILQKK